MPQPSELASLTAAAYEATRDDYRMAIAASLAGQPAERHWAAVRRSLARALALAGLVGLARGFAVARAHGAELPAPDERPLPAAHFAKPKLQFPEAFSIEEFTEAVEAFRGRVPMLRDQVEALYREADALSQAIVGAESQSAVAELAKKSTAIQEAISRGFWASDLDAGTTVNLKEILAESIGGYTEATVDRRGRLRVNGVGLPEFIDRAQLAGAAGLTDARLETIYRNNLSGQYTESSLAAISGPEVRAVIPCAVLFNPRDRRSRPAHAAMSGYVATVESIRERGLATPCGHNCVLPGTRVGGRCQAALKARYSGPVVDLETRLGHRLTVTVNHPVLTHRGWVPAAMLHEGDYLFSHHVSDHSVPTRQDEQHPPAAIEDVFESLAAKGRRSVEVTALDLHGDAALTDGDIDVVVVDRELQLRGDAVLDQDVGESLLSRVDLDLPLENCFGSPDAPLYGVNLATATSPRAGALALDRRAARLHLGPLDQLLLGRIAALDVPAIEKEVYGSARHAVFLGQLIHAGAGFVVRDELVRIERQEWAGHVFDLQTAVGWYSANRVIISNCRCDWRPISSAEAERLGVLTDGELDPAKARARNGLRELLVDSGQYPDPGWRSR